MKTLLIRTDREDFLMKWTASLLFILAIIPGFTKDLINNAMVDTANLMPERVITFGVHHSQSQFVNEFNSNGRKNSIAALMNKNYSYNDLIKEELDPNRKVLTAGALKAYGIDNLEDTAGEHFGNIELQSEVNSLFLGYGASSKLSFFAILPIVKLKVNFSNQFQRSSQFDEIIKKLKNEGNFSQVNEIEDKLSNPIRYQLEDYGYEPLYPRETQALGDLRLLSRFNYNKDDNIVNTLGLFAVLPTGKQNDINQFMDLYIGDGQWDIGLETLNSFQITPSFNYFFSASYTYQARKRGALRIPLESEKLISPDIDYNTRQKFGDIIRIQNQVNYQFNPEWNTSFGYIFQYKEQDKINGKTFEPIRYQYLENGTREKIHALYIGVGFNSIDMFLKQKFMIPMNLSLTYSQSIGGENALYNNEIALSLLSFYR